MKKLLILSLFISVSAFAGRTELQHMIDFINAEKLVVADQRAAQTAANAKAHEQWAKQDKAIADRLAQLQAALASPSPSPSPSP